MPHPLRRSLLQYASQGQTLLERNWEAESWSRSILFGVMSKPRTTTKELTSLAFSCPALLTALVDGLWHWSWIGSKCVGVSHSPVQSSLQERIFQHSRWRMYGEEDQNGTLLILSRDGFVQLMVAESV